MTNYLFSIENPQQQYIRIQVTFEVTQKVTIVRIPAWRPGRYELGNFAKNVKGFKVVNENGNLLSFTKTTKDSWEVDTDGVSKILVDYFYYAAELNAGSSFLSSEQLYVNPVNCCVYTDESASQPLSVTLDIPDAWTIASSMKLDDKTMFASSFDELADAPFLCSPTLQYRTYTVATTLFHIWFQGECKPDWNKMIPDFEAFTKKQIEKFNEFPTDEYHFIFQILPFKAYHGVEHCKSTVILLGPSYEVFGSLYKELLGISSHELYHTWNVKAIRPIEMYPYDFQKENYSRMGYLCEGVTTYMGDLFLLKSGVFSLDQYLVELVTQFQKHFDNFGRFNYSVGDSSFDTWLDGYVPGAPGRKVSIYTEGCLLAFVTDVLVWKGSGYKYSLDRVMKNLYFNYALKGKGVSETDYKNELRNFIGDYVDELFDNYFHGTHSLASILTEALDLLGLELIDKPNASYSAGRLGFKYLQKVVSIYPGSPADMAMLTINDEIIAVNSCLVNNDLDKWLTYFDDDLKILTVLRSGKLLEIQLPEVQRSFYNEYQIVGIEKPDHQQIKALRDWIS
ncbi:MAG: M61 family peptidase [Bacteroidota bacterium]